MSTVLLFAAQGDSGLPGKLGPSGPDGERGPMVIYELKPLKNQHPHLSIPLYFKNTISDTNVVDL